MRTKRDNHKLEITIVFGENEEDISKSMKQEDFNFFKEFPNIQICFEKRLHAKYFANESAAILTSINLHSHSLDNNIEAGVMTKVTLLGAFAFSDSKRTTESARYLMNLKSPLMTQTNITPQIFLRISSLLTGFTETELKATGMLDCYLNTILENNDKDDIKYFFQNAGAILDAPKQTVKSTKDAISTQLIPDSNYGGLAKNIIILWYTGNWGGNVVSAASYIQGLMWDAGHTHPPGAKQPGYGSWANLPPSIQYLNSKTHTDGKQ